MGDKLFQIAWEALQANKTRSILTMLGVIIGVLAVIVMIGMGQASQAYITSQVQGMGANALIITPGNPKTPSFGPPGLFSAPTLTLDDAEVVAVQPGVETMSAQAFTQTLLKCGAQQLPGMIIGTMAAAQEVRALKVAQGRFLTDQEGRNGARVMVLGPKLLKDLTKDGSPSLDGLRIKVENQSYRVVGVLESQGGGLFGSTDDQAFIPIRAFQQNLQDGKKINSIFLRVTPPKALTATRLRLSELLRIRHKIRQDEDDDFNVQTQEELLSTVKTVTQVFTVLLAAIASISLLVGGIGIMNIMLVSVTERTQEIGIRKAVGAKRRDILGQFLVEAATLSVLGGTIGMIIGIGITVAATRAMGLPYVFSPGAVIGAFLFSAGIGIFFGLYPANRASKLDPVEAMRFE
jgi:putative ABC transport system permease protein